MSRVRVSLSSRELEVEGTDEFVAQYSDALKMMLERLESLPVEERTRPSDSSAASKGVPLGGSFGETVQRLPKTATGVDQILLAGSFAQAQSTDTTFSTNEANKLLVEQGIKLSNASQSIKNNLIAKRIFKVGRRYRLSKMGEEHLASLVT